MDLQVAQLAERQHAVVSRRQVTALGVTPAAIQHRLRSGRWVLVRPGVYRLPGSAPTWEQGLMAVTLAAGPAAVASHRSAAALLGVPGFRRSGTVEITTPRPQRHRLPGAVVHRTLELPPGQLTVVDGIPCTRPARTLLDLAGVLPARRTERAVDNCLAMKLVEVGDLEIATRGPAPGGRASRSCADCSPSEARATSRRRASWKPVS